MDEYGAFREEIKTSFPGRIMGSRTDLIFPNLRSPKDVDPLPFLIGFDENVAKKRFRFELLESTDPKQYSIRATPLEPALKSSYSEVIVTLHRERLLPIAFEYHTGRGGREILHYRFLKVAIDPVLADDTFEPRKPEGWTITTGSTDHPHRRSAASHVTSVPRPAGASVDRCPELLQSEPLARADAHDRQGPATGQIQQVANLRLDMFGAGEIGLVNDDNVGNLELTGLFPLQVVAGLWLYEHDHDLGNLANRSVPLSGPNSLHDHGVESVCAKETSHPINVRRDARMATGRGQTADEHTLVVEPARHADAIAE